MFTMLISVSRGGRGEGVGWKLKVAVMGLERRLYLCMFVYMSVCEQGNSC